MCMAHVIDCLTNRYASRVKLITNAAQKNAENKEIAKLKSVSSCSLHILSPLPGYQVIAKLKRGEEVEDED